MSKKLFTEEEIIILKQNKYVKKVTSKGITYTDEFKRIFIDENGNGKLPVLYLRVSVSFIAPPFLKAVRHLLAEDLTLCMPIISILKPHSSNIILGSLPLILSFINIFLNSSV